MNRMNVVVVAVVALSLLSPPVHAEEVAKKQSTGKSIAKGTLIVVVMEAAFLFNAGIAASEPQGWGITMGLLAPVALVMTEEKSAGDWVAFAGAEALCAVNVFALESDEDDWDHNFDVTFFGLNGLWAAAMITDHFTRKDKPPTVSFGVERHSGGEFVTASYRF